MDIKEMRARQKGGRKKARDLAARERTFRREKLRAETNARSFNRDKNQNRGNVKVQRSSYGRLLSQVVLVGGATRMPAIGRMLTALTGVTPQKTVNPDEAVALGAAIQVGILDGDDRLGGMQVLNPMQAAVLRAFAKKRQLLDS
jgi:molecular chaperone DnaK (HSP70)